MTNDAPLAYFITWTVYGTHLQGDQRGWRKRRKGNQVAQPLLSDWRSRRLKYAIVTLTDPMQQAVESECQRHCAHRGWRLWAVNVRTNHIHVVVTATDYAGKTVRDQLKANSTRGLRERWETFYDRPVWTTGGDWECINDENDLEAVIRYVLEAQDRMDRND